MKPCIDYTKRVLHAAFGDAFDPNPDPISLGASVGIVHIDGAIDSEVAVKIMLPDIEQLGNAILALRHHPFPIKSLILIGEQVSDDVISEYRNIVREATSSDTIVINLIGSDNDAQFDNDVLKVKMRIWACRM